jgi:hypothetical protein
MEGALLKWREGFGTARKKRTTAGPKNQKARQTVALAQKKERVPPLLLPAPENMDACQNSPCHAIAPIDLSSTVLSE